MENAHTFGASASHHLRVIYFEVWARQPLVQHRQVDDQPHLVVLLGNT